MFIFGNCCHIKDKITGELCGDELVGYAAKLVKEQQVTKKPKNILKDEHHMLSLSKTHSKNFGGRPLALQAAKISFGKNNVRAVFANQLPSETS